MVDIKREKRKPAKKGASKKKKKGASKKKPATSVQRLLDSDAWRADTRWPRKKEVHGYDPSAWDIPGGFEAAAYHFKIWPFYRGPDAKPFKCLQARPENAPIYYDGGRKVHTGWYNSYFSVC
jgi:hypothetical protein